MADISKISPDDGSTILNVKDRNAVHWSESQGYVGKNLSPNNATSQTINGVTFTVNADKSITVNGTATGNITNYYMNNYTSDDFPFDISNEYILSGCPVGGSSNSYRLDVIGESGISYGAEDTGNGIKFQFPKVPTGNEKFSVRIRIGNGTVCNNLVFKPMIRLSSISDSTYEPYLTPNTEIDNKLSYADNAVLGAKNFNKSVFTTQTIDGVTFTYNSDGSITADGTSTAEIWYADTGVVWTLPKGQYILTGCPDTGASSSSFDYRIFFRENPSTSRNYYEYGTGTYVDLSTDMISRMFIHVKNGVTLNNVVFKPMIRLASDTDDTYVPYAMTNQQITSALNGTIANPYIVPSGGDLNTIKTNGVYKWGNTYYPTNSPSNKTNCYMFVFFNDSDLYTQIVFEGGWRNQDGHIYIRGTSDGGTNWSAWRKVSDSVLS